MIKSVRLQQYNNYKYYYHMSANNMSMFLRLGDTPSSGPIHGVHHIDLGLDNNTNSSLSTEQRFFPIKRIAKQKARLVFLLKCRRQEIYPRFLLDKVNKIFRPYENNGARIGRSIEKQRMKLLHGLLNTEISQCSRLIEIIEKPFCSGDHDAKGHNILVFNEHQQQVFESQLKESNQHLFRKYSVLLEQQNHLEDIKYDPTFIKNFTDLDIQKDVLLLLSLGPKFSTVPEQLPIMDLATDVEFIISRYADEEIKRPLRGSTFYSLTKWSKTQLHFNRIERFLQKATENTRRFFQQHPDVFVSTSDKGAVTILAYKEEYNTKMLNLVGDPTMFAPLDCDPTHKCQLKNNNLVDEWFGQKRLKGVEKRPLSKTEKYERLRYITKRAITPRLFGQMKYHKPGRPVRCIVTTINSAAYSLSRKLSSIIRSSFQPKYNIKNSQQLLKLIKHTNFNSDNILVSFDVVNCYGNIPTEIAIRIIEQNFDKIEANTNIPKDLFIRMLKFCLNEANYFIFQGKFYKQLLGMFMGSSLAPILVERVLEEVVQHTLEKLDFVPDLWCVYVDDHLTSIPREKVDVVLNLLNAYHPTIQFTAEIQEENSINYLDLTIHKHSSRITTEWFCKPIASNRLLNFYSAHPSQMVLNTAKSFARRVLTLSHKKFHEKCNTTIKEILAKNNFPPKIVEKLIKEVFCSRNNSSRRDRNVSYPFLNSTLVNNTAESQPSLPPQQYSGLTFVPKVSQSLSRLLMNDIPDLKISARPPNRNSLLFTNMKDKIPPKEQSGLVYKIDCKDCNKCYVGETVQKLCTRITQHQRDVKAGDSFSLKTALVKHTVDLKHSFDFDNVSILCKENVKRKLQLQEINQIIAQRNLACNFKSDCVDISPAYFNLINDLNNRNCVNQSIQHASLNQSIQLIQPSFQSTFHFHSTLRSTNLPIHNNNNNNRTQSFNSTQIN